MPESVTERPAARPVRLIAYAWGDKYVDELLSLTLAAALAPNNLPAVAALAPTELVLLIQKQHYDRVAEHRTIQRLRQLCRVRLVGLDDLIVSSDKYGMTLTYALHRGMRAFGADMTETYFLFLNADFIIADGSLRNALLALMRGERLVAAPSYCTIAHKIRPDLRSFMDRRSGALAVPPRAMARLVLRHLHNTIKGKTLNQPDFHLLQMDQFYWRIDDNTLLGHQMPVAIVGMRPERVVDEPNSYWDHGLIGEFCPDAKPLMLGDSDDFLMAELREREVAAEQIVTGSLDPRAVAERMIGWVTPYQRSFAELPLTLHAEGVSSGTTDQRAKLAACVAEILSYAPKVFPSHRDHPQWHYHLGGFMAARHERLSDQLGRATEKQEPPADLTPIDKAWWRLDGARKRYARRNDSETVTASLFFAEDLGNRDPVEVELAALGRSYAKLLRNKVTSALVPQVRLLRSARDGPIRSPHRSLLDRVSPVLQRQLRLAGYRSSLRRARGAIAKAVSEGARDVLVIGGDLKLAEELAPNIPGLCAAVSSRDVRSGNLAHALDPALKFDLCLWELNAEELADWRDAIASIRFCMKPDATIVGFCPHHRAAQQLTEAWELGDDVASDVYVDRTSRAVSIFNRGRRALAKHGLVNTISLVFQHIGAARAAALEQGAVRVSGARAANRSPAAVTVIARFAAEISSPDAEIGAVPTDAETELTDLFQPQRASAGR